MIKEKEDEIALMEEGHRYVVQENIILLEHDHDKIEKLNALTKEAR